MVLPAAATSATEPACDPALPPGAPCMAGSREVTMEQLLALEMVRVTEAAAIASARFMGRGRSRRGGPRGDRGHAPHDGRDGHRRHHRHRRGRAGRGADAVHRRAGRAQGRRRRGRGGRHRRRSARGHEPRRHRVRGRDHRARGLREGRPDPRTRHVHGEALRRAGGRGLRRHHAPRRGELPPHRRGPAPARPGHHGDHPRAAAPRGADRRGPRRPAPGSSSSATATCRPRSRARSRARASTR